MLLLAGCAGAPRTSTPMRGDTTVPEAWHSAPSPGDELDSLAVWPSETGTPWVIATAKSSHRLVVFDGDSGQRLRTVGERGQQPGQFDRPNGVAVFGDLLLVAERDNRRVQVFGLPEFKPLLTFGEDVLRAPYGLWVHETAPGQLEVFVTDSYMVRSANGVRSHDKENDWLPPPIAELGERIKRFRVDEEDDGTVKATYLDAFGDTGQSGALRMVESIAGDVANDRLLIAEEDPRSVRTLRDYTLQGRYRGDDLPAFAADPEGVALWNCDADQRGYWVAVDQLKPTLFRVFDRDNLRPMGTFSGDATANTDGIALYAAGTPRFPAGVLYAVDDDLALSAFDLGEVARALNLSKTCQP
ncbi:MAG TPA: phytase [Pseudoxanthomonas sp.]|nr:phytase [Pseudoxanthomonas sp.]